jgi:hypothetical protein
MIEVEIQKLTAAIEALTKAVLGSGRPTLVVTNGTPTKLTTLEEAERSYREDDAVREAMQAERTAMMKKIDGAMRDVVNDAISRPKPVEDAERLAKLDKIEREQAEHAKTMDEVYGKTLAEKKAEDDQKLADLYKAEQAKAKRKAAKVTKEEAEALIEAAKPVENTECTDQPLKDKEDNPKSPKPEKIAANISIAEALAPVAHLIPDAANIGEGDLKTLAMEIARADSSARTTILEILGEHGAKTITQLDPKNYRAVHGRFLSLAHDIAKDGEEI